MEDQHSNLQYENTAASTVPTDEKNNRLPNNHMVLAIISTILNIFSFSLIGIIFGVLSIIFANEVKTIYNSGDHFGAMLKSKDTRILSIISLIIFFFNVLIYILLILFIIFFGNMFYYQGWFKNG